jgi:exodeoxyribonuclease VII large subunit
MAFKTLSTLANEWSESTYTVSEVSAHLKEYLESNPLLSDLTVVGEVANHRKPGSGHHYFTLRDERASLNCVMFRSGRGGRFLQDGAQAIIRGRISMYVARGDVQLYADSVRPAGQGALQQAFEELKARLSAEGLFDPGRKRPLPEFPGRIAVITSPTGAVIQDILNVLSRRYPLVEVVVIPSAVQGERAAPELVGAFETLDSESDIDLVILARGGGSLEDLWSFNEEQVARAIFASRIPVVSAIGHETDFTIIDQVADMRAPTPSAAAELVVPDRLALRRELDDSLDRYGRAVASLIEARRTEISRRVRWLESGLPDAGTWRRRVDDLARIAGASMLGRLALAKGQVESISLQLEALNPVAILNRGFSVVQKATSNRKSGAGQVVTKQDQVADGEGLVITVADGVIKATAGGEKAAKAPVKKRRAVPQESGMKRLL